MNVSLTIIFYCLMLGLLTLRFSVDAVRHLGMDEREMIDN